MESQSPHTAHNWALVACHLDVHTFLLLMSTCRELYHNLPLALPKWHFKDSFRLSMEDLNDLNMYLKKDTNLAAKHLYFATDPYKHNREWLVERLFAFAHLGVRVDVRLPLLRHMQDDPRFHSTVRIVVPDNEDIITALKGICSMSSDSSTTTTTDADHCTRTNTRTSAEEEEEEEDTTVVDLDDSGLGIMDTDTDGGVDHDRDGTSGGHGDGLGKSTNSVDNDDDDDNKGDGDDHSNNGSSSNNNSFPWDTDSTDAEEMMDKGVDAVTTTAVAPTHPAVRGPATVTWVVEVCDDEDLTQLNQRLAAVASVTTVERLCVHLRKGARRLVMRDIMQLVVRVYGNSIGHLETTNVHTLRLVGPMRQRVLQGKCHGLNTVYVAGEDDRTLDRDGIASVPALAGARTVHIAGLPMLSDLSPFRDAEHVTLIKSCEGADLNSLENARFLSARDCVFSGNEKFVLPKAEEVCLRGLEFRQPTQVYCPKAVRLSLRCLRELAQVFSHPQLQHLTATPEVLPAIQAEHVEEADVTVLVQQAEGGGLDPPFVNGCAIVDGWKHVPRKLWVTISTGFCEVTLVNPPNVMAVAEILVDLRFGAKALWHMPGDLLAAMSAHAGDEGDGGAVSNQAPQHELCISRLELCSSDRTAYTVEGVDEVVIRSKVTAVVRGARHVRVKGEGSVVTVEDCEEVHVEYARRLAKVSGVRVCTVQTVCLGIGMVEKVHLLRLRKACLDHVTLEDVAQFGCDVLRVDGLQLQGEQMKVPKVLNMWSGTGWERFCVLFCHSQVDEQQSD